MVERHFTDKQIDEFLAAYLKRYPDALDRMLHVMRNPFDDNDVSISRIFREMIEISRDLDFFVEFEKSNNETIYLIRKEIFRKVSKFTI
ncbi:MULTISPECIES: hypothetical protein [unclassified Agrobacterium]|uniref:hypothetical protein n=1 Tax=unclassified Agrobacterium TaxID=2632611 RepID=UPI002448E72C|nr:MULTISPECIES: hypothetical protein [unclassified Agrobacterium]MDH0616692.1 hypothetical protein [Agrobacterium sp. GD03872]MDH0699273.1 hypothetical protein [Agrobacterium sp. GD03871]MDH1062023.1 hypothetical protein [Agrobacterium sp. GD03992]MDH2213545.1 hypothetical protein [Agrobacterium sp. GD03643]MDH2220128.1 hypothetical protein [Agrobacterium sp. GD03638]